jgi:hypothetical protein
VSPFDDHQKRHAWGDDRVDPDSLIPRDEEEAVGPDGPSRGVLVRALSVVPFLLVATLGLLGIVSWVIVIILGAGGGEPIWRALDGLSPAQIVWQLLLAVLIGLTPVAAVLAASWATVHGYDERAGRTFWTVTQGVWGLAAVGLVYVRQARHDWVDQLGASSTDWWFALGVVAFAMILAGVRLRRAPRSAAR